MVVSAPSGAGKTTLCREVIKRLGGIVHSISHTTRSPRKKERNGIDYHFVDDATFDQLIKENSFLEWAHVHGKRYGTVQQTVTQHLAQGTDVLFDIDVQGGAQIAKAIKDAVLLFIMPPSQEVLEARLRRRKSDSEEQIALRLRVAKREIQAASMYHHTIVNDDIAVAIKQFEALVLSERRKRIDHGS